MTLAFAPPAGAPICYLGKITRTCAATSPWMAMVGCTHSHRFSCWAPTKRGHMIQMRPCSLVMFKREPTETSWIRKSASEELGQLASRHFPKGQLMTSSLCTSPLVLSQGGHVPSDSNQPLHLPASQPFACYTSPDKQCSTGASRRIRCTCHRPPWPPSKLNNLLPKLGVAMLSARHMALTTS